MNAGFEYLDETEKIIFMLRKLYMDAGYKRYRMSKFEEYDLYSRNKSYLVSDAIITFTDTDGKLMALKPDVTLSIIKNTPEGKGVTRLCYNESVYRVASGTRTFREIMQTGLECMGEVDTECLCEVIGLAVRSLLALGHRCVLEISDLDILGAFVDAMGADEVRQKSLYECAVQKNLHELKRLAQEEPALDDERVNRLIRLLNLGTYEPFSMEGLRALCKENCGERLRVFEALTGYLRENKLDRYVQFDFSCAGNRHYYNGLIFKGYIDGISQSVLAGGQYDKLMRRMEKRGRAIGFAVYLDRLERLSGETKEDEDVC